jgi:NitT/TauT family transport system substrate-binding protein
VPAAAICLLLSSANVILGGEVMSPRAFRHAAISRRSFLKTSALTAGALALPLAPFRARAAGPLKPVTMALDWLYEGTNVGFMVAHEQGFFREAGLDVEVSSGKGSGSTAQLVASKAIQIGFSDGFVVANGIAKGMAIKTVGSIFRRGPATIMVLAESSIKTPKDLEGKTVAMNASSAVFQQWPAFVKGAGIDGAKINIVNVDSAGLGPALISGKVDAIGGYPASYVPSIEILGKKEARILWFADAGVSVVGNGIVVHQDLLKSDPDIIRAFMPAAIKGFLYGRQHPDAAVAAAQKYQSTVDPAIVKRGFEISWKSWVTPHTKGKPLGWEADEDWASTIQVLKQYGGVTASLQPSDVFTNEFVPAGDEYVPPQDA